MVRLNHILSNNWAHTSRQYRIMFTIRDKNYFSNIFTTERTFQFYVFQCQIFMVYIFKINTKLFSTTFSETLENMHLRTYTYRGSEPNKIMRVQVALAYRPEQLQGCAALGLRGSRLRLALYPLKLLTEKERGSFVVLRRFRCI